MKVVIINRSDSIGGAAIASHRLLHALIDEGVEAHMLVIDKQLTDDPAVMTVGNGLKNKWNFLAERMGIALRTGFDRDTLFKIDPATHGLNLARHPLVKDADVIVLGWINQGMLSLKGVEQLAALGKPVIWVMHDMWNCTGVCHHSIDCTAFQSTCQACPLLGGKTNDLSTDTQRRKAELYRKYPNIHFVAVSNWLRRQCRESSLMSKYDVSVIPNAFPIEKFTPLRLPNSDYGIDPDKKVMVMGAARLDDPVKGFDMLIDTTKYIASVMPDLAQRLHLLLFGGIKDASLLEQIALPYTHLGTVSDVTRVYTYADVVLSTAQRESFGLTLLEGLACGCVPVTFGKGGQDDIVDHLNTGYVAMFQEPADMAHGIAWAIDAPVTRQQLHQAAAQKFDAGIIARQFVELFESLLAKSPQV